MSRSPVGAGPIATSVGALTDRRVLAALAVALWLAVLAVGRAWGLALIERGQQIVLFTPPVLGGYRPSIPTALWLPTVVGLSLAIALPAVVRRTRWVVLVGSTTAAALGWWISLALVDGTEGVTRGLYWQADYAGLVGQVGRDPGGFLRGFVDAVPSYSIAVRAHPPGLTLVFGLMDRLGLSGPGWAAALVLAVAASAVPALLIAVRDLAGEGWARRVAPAVALAPAAIWMATSTDALYVGVAAWFMVLVVRATGATGRRADLLAVAAGVLAAALALLSYGLVLMALPALLVAWYRRSWRPMAIVAVVAGALVVALVPLGFWYWDAFVATKHQYDTLDLSRPYSYFVVNNLAAWALAIGPATAAGLALLRDRRMWVLVGGGVLAVVVADLSGLSEGEVERIWLPFTIWVVAAGAALIRDRQRVVPRLWLVAQVLTALVLTAKVGTNW